MLSPLGERLMPLWIVGLLIGGGSLLQLALDVPAGYLLDKYGYRFLLKVTTLLFLGATLCFYFGLTQMTFVLSIFIATFGWLFFNPGIDAYVLSQAPNKNTGRFMSYRDIFSALGVVVSGACLPFVLFMQSKEIGLFLSCFFVIAFVVLSFSPKDVVHHETKTIAPKQIHRFSTLHIIQKLNPASTMLLLLILRDLFFTELFGL